MQDRTSRRDGTSQPGGNAAADDGVAELLLRLHGADLSQEQARELRLSLEAQTAAISVLRRYTLKNDDAPCFSLVAPRVVADG